MNEAETEMLKVIKLEKYLVLAPTKVGSPFPIFNQFNQFTAAGLWTQEVLQGGDAASASLKLAQASSIGIIVHVGMNQNPQKKNIFRADEDPFISNSGVNYVASGVV